jgi:hypothetical protein
LFSVAGKRESRRKRWIEARDAEDEVQSPEGPWTWSSGLQEATGGFEEEVYTLERSLAAEREGFGEL